jgi:hypothetical protein
LQGGVLVAGQVLHDLGGPQLGFAHRVEHLLAQGRGWHHVVKQQLHGLL